MEFKTKVNYNIKTSIRCPKCKEKFDKPAGEDTSMRCSHCGTQLRLSKESIDDVMKETEAKVAGTLASMGIPLPQNYADIAKAKSLTKLLNIIGVVVTIWTFFFPIFYEAAIFSCALIPIVSIMVMSFLKELISFETKKRKSEEPYLTFALAGPPLALAWRALNDFHVLVFSNIWLPAATVSIIFSSLIFLFSADVKKKPAYLLVTLIFGFTYGYGMIVEANCLLDKSVPRAYTAKVLGKRISYTSHSHSYYIKVTPWGTKTGENEISIKKRGFDHIKVNDEINIDLKDGMLNIPWFTVRVKT